MLTRRAVITPILVATLPAFAQGGRRTPRIGMLWHAANEEEERYPLGQFRQGLKDLGYIEGQNILIELRFPAEKPELFERYAAELADSKVDILFAVTRPAAVAAQKATQSIPVVFMAVPDPVGSKLVETLSRPGANVTGISNMALELTPKRVELLKEVAGLDRVALLVNANDPEGARRYVEHSETAVRHLGIIVEPVEIYSGEDIDRAFENMKKNGIQGVVLTQDGLIYAEQPRIFRAAMARKLPVIGYSREMASNGAFMTYGPNNGVLFRRAAAFVDKILKGTKGVADLPVEQPENIELVINIRAADALGLSVPNALRIRADDLIE